MLQRCLSWTNNFTYIIIKRGKKMTWFKKRSSLSFSLNSLFPSRRQRAIVANICIILFPLKDQIQSWLLSSQLWYFFTLLKSWIYYFAFFADILEVNYGIPFKERINIWESPLKKILCSSMLNVPSIKLNLSICFLQGVATCSPPGEKLNRRNTVLPLFQYLSINRWLLHICCTVSPIS